MSNNSQEHRVMPEDRQSPQRPLLIVGHGLVLQECVTAWRAAQPERPIESLELRAPDNFNYDLTPIGAYPSDAWLFFVALSNEAINFRRLKLMTDLRLQGRKLDRFISPRAMTPPDWIAGENGFVSDGAVVGVDVTTKHNCWIGPRAVVGSGVQMGHSVWIGAGSIVGEGVSLGDNTSVGSGAIVANGVTVGRQCELLVAREYRDAIPDRTFFSPLFPSAARIYGRPSAASQAKNG
jgi:hypothetical protein